MPKITLVDEVSRILDREFDAIHLGTCIVKAKNAGKYPLDFDQLGTLVKNNFGKDMVVGTHPY